MSEDNDPSDEPWRAAIRLALAALPADFSEAVFTAQRLERVLQAEVAIALESRLNRHVQTMPQWSLDDKRLLAESINAQLRSVGVAIRCPQTGRAAYLVADYCSDKSRDSRFRLETRDDAGRRHRTFTSGDLPALHLREASPMKPLKRDKPGADRSR